MLKKGLRANKLTFKNYFKEFSKKVHFKVYCIKRLIFLPIHIRIMFFKSFILPHFDYCSSLFTYFSATLINRIESFFNTVIFKLFRIDLKPLAVNVQYGLLSSMNIMPFRYRLFTRFALFSHKIMNNVFLPDIKEQATKSLVISRTQRSASLNKFIRSSMFESINTRTKSGEKWVSVFLNNFLNNIIKDSYTLSLSFYKTFLN